MKNYELVGYLMKLPAGEDVKFIATISKEEIQFSDDGECELELDIEDVDESCGNINLM